ncbi:MAG: hypothetical protein PUB61_02705 [Bacteroidales bacterium]|nr:hypothetical protein [Bacteroidales bacterium]
MSYKFFGLFQPQSIQIAVNSFSLSACDLALFQKNHYETEEKDVIACVSEERAYPHSVFWTKKRSTTPIFRSKKGNSASTFTPEDEFLLMYNRLCVIPRAAVSYKFFGYSKKALDYTAKV